MKIVIENKSYLIICIFCFSFWACSDEVPLTPKPRAYPKIEFPEGGYRSFDTDYCNFSFEYPVYSQIQQDTVFFDKKPVHPCWFDVYYPAFDGRVHFSYYPIGEEKSLEVLKADAFELVDWHHKKANYVEEIPFYYPEHEVSGFAFSIEGPAASPFQFYLTDSIQHFVRAAVYFNTQAKPDSLSPVYRFVRKDVLHMIESFEWKQEEKI